MLPQEERRAQCRPLRVIQLRLHCLWIQKVFFLEVVCSVAVDFGHEVADVARANAANSQRQSEPSIFVEKHFCVLCLLVVFCVKIVLMRLEASEFLQYFFLDKLKYPKKKLSL